MDEPEPHTRKRDDWLFVTVGISTISMLVAIVAVGIGWRGTGGAESVAAGGKAETVQVDLGDMYISPKAITIDAGAAVTFEVTNRGNMPHDFKVGGTDGIDLLDPGKSATVTVDDISSATEAWCTVAGHKAAGMVMQIEVDGASSAPASEAAAATGAEATGATIDPEATPAADWKPFDPALRPAPGGTEHEVTMHAEEGQVEVAPGVTQTLWTFDGQAPGPVLRGKVGDLFTVTLVNDGKMGHSIDFHASKVAWSDEMRTIQPGESLVYQYRAEYAGIFMYHCGTAPALHHIGNGMFGAIIIDPPNLPKVDHEYVLVQSELYLGPEGKEGDLAKMQAEDFDAVVFNGYVNQYRFAPIRVEPEERIRVWVLDAGPNEDSSFHIVGTVFDTVFKEGTKVLEPDARKGGAQALDLQPAQGGYVEFSFAEKGFYPIVTHKFANVGKGAMGLFQAGDAEMPAGAAH